MTNNEFENAFDLGYLDDEYFEFIMNHADADEKVISNGDALLEAYESLYLFDEFRQSKIKTAKND